MNTFKNTIQVSSNENHQTTISDNGIATNSLNVGGISEKISYVSSSVTPSTINDGEYLINTSNISVISYWCGDLVDKKVITVGGDTSMNLFQDCISITFDTAYTPPHSVINVLKDSVTAFDKLVIHDEVNNLDLMTIYYQNDGTITTHKESIYDSLSVENSIKFILLDEPIRTEDDCSVNITNSSQEVTGETIYTDIPEIDIYEIHSQIGGEYMSSTFVTVSSISKLSGSKRFPIYKFDLSSFNNPMTDIYMIRLNVNWNVEQSYVMEIDFIPTLTMVNSTMYTYVNELDWNEISTYYQPPILIAANQGAFSHLYVQMANLYSEESYAQLNEDIMSSQNMTITLTINNEYTSTINTTIYPKTSETYLTKNKISSPTVETDNLVISNLNCETLNGCVIDKTSSSMPQTPFIPVVKDDMYMEVGRGIDFHSTGSGITADHSARVSVSTASNSSPTLTSDVTFTAPNLLADNETRLEAVESGKTNYKHYSTLTDALSDWSNIPVGTFVSANNGVENLDTTYIFKADAVRALTFSSNKIPKDYIYFRAITNDSASSSPSSISASPFRKIPVLTSDGVLNIASTATSDYATRAAEFLNANLSTNNELIIKVGKANSDSECGIYGYVYDETSPYLALGMYSHDRLYKFYKDKFETTQNIVTSNNATIEINTIEQRALKVINPNPYGSGSGCRITVGDTQTVTDGNNNTITTHTEAVFGMWTEGDANNEHYAYVKILGAPPSLQIYSDRTKLANSDLNITDGYVYAKNIPSSIIHTTFYRPWRLEMPGTNNHPGYCKFLLGYVKPASVLATENSSIFSYWTNFITMDMVWLTSDNEYIEKRYLYETRNKTASRAQDSTLQKIRESLGSASNTNWAYILMENYSSGSINTNIIYFVCTGPTNNEGFNVRIEIESPSQTPLYKDKQMTTPITEREIQWYDSMIVYSTDNSATEFH